VLDGVGFAVRVAEDGAAGVELFRTWRPHFIWMDVRMPVMDGLEATRRIRALDGGRDVKIVALTASVFRDEADEVTAAGMDGLVRKPYQRDEIFDALAHHLGVHFLRAERPGAANVVAGAPVATAALAAVAPELRAELQGALDSLDATRVSGAITRIAAVEPALGEALAQRAGRFEYTTIMEALQQSPPTSDEAEAASPGAT
jgi:CheY-like chemotaxis protein